MHAASCEYLVGKISDLQLLPQADKDTLLEGARISYGHAQALLPRLSIFSKIPINGILDDFEFTLITGEPIYYAGISLKSNLAIFFDGKKKIIFNSRYYLTHLNGFLENIDSCLNHLQELKLDDAVNIGSSFCTIEKWFYTYGHFKDEAYNIGSFLSKLPSDCNFKALLDYPEDSGLDTPNFKHNANYRVIDKLIFNNNSLNAYNAKGGLLRLNDLVCISNGFNSRTFHSFHVPISKRIKSQISVVQPGSSGKSVVVTRSNSYRDIGNKLEVEQLLVERGFSLVNPEQISYDNLIRTLSAADCAFFYYGSALTNMVYLPPRAKVFILKSESYMSENIDLWSKVIATYELRVTEILAHSNVIDLDVLASTCSAGKANC
jgi:hypothetical protein